jgi:hypothetical protein
MNLEPVDSAGEENYLAIAVRLSWELSRLGLTTLGGGEETLLRKSGRLDGVGGLRGRKETVGDEVRPDEEGKMSVIDGFRASCFRKKEFSCCNLHISA